MRPSPTAYVARSGAYAELVLALVVIGAGSGLFFAPVAAVLLAVVAPDEQGQASGVAGAVRELAAVLGVAVLGAVLAGPGGDPGLGVGLALWLGAGIAAVGALAALALPRSRPPAGGSPARSPGGPTTEPITTPGRAVVRRAADAERGVIRALLGVAYPPYQTAVPPEAWERYLADLLDLDRHARDGELLVATVDGAVDGYAAFYPDATAQGLGWPAGWASGRGPAVDPSRRGRGVAAALMADFERRAQLVGAPVFAFHTASFKTTARALYERLGYRRAPAFDRDMNAHYGVRATQAWTALAYRKSLAACPAVAA